MDSFKAFRVHTLDGKAVCRFEPLALEQLDAGAVVIRVAFSAINYKDAMAARGVGKNVRADRPCVTGIDLSGTVVTSTDERYRAGDRVVVTNYQLGNEHDGGYAEYARVPADWIVPLPDGLSLYEAMGLGTSGLTAALAVDRLERNGLTPADGPVAVSGATGSVGSLAVDMLAVRGFAVAAISGKAERASWLRSLGAGEVIDRHVFLGKSGSLISNPPFGGGVDNVGGQMLDRLLASTRPHGAVAIGGMIDIGVQTTVLPFVLRSVDVLGINVSRQLAMAERRRLWTRMASDLKPRHLQKIARPIAFEGLDGAMDSLLEGTSFGRIVVEVGEKAPVT